jgi:hypothetical protein
MTVTKARERQKEVKKEVKRVATTSLAKTMK